MKPLRNAEQVLRLSLACDEHVKSRASRGLGLELATGIAAVAAAFGGPVRTYAPLVAVLLAAMAAAAIISSNSQRVNARRSRRLALRALALAKDVPLGTLTQIRAVVPTYIQLRADRMADLTLHAYYSPRNEPGSARLRELYAHSIFFSCALVRTLAVLMLSLSAVALAVAVVVFYALAVSPAQDTHFRIQLLDLLTTCILLIIALRAGATGYAALAAHSTYARLFQRFVDVSAAEVIDDLAMCYELLRVRGPLVPKLLYNMHRRTLIEQWRRVSKQFIRDQDNDSNCGDFAHA